ncbi:histidinol phosphate phosphatase H [Protomyces lactucae-debilis]|uniref:Histidinol-phosphatase n=1 Tax=Protomyces lactucae-debilis TaxID=2754530 RepID=A0A1Y2F7R5_PROLT|nr:histidinol phosphate phosphatase H [Protomyces lactucae-debilis]ORY79938.1 histidinol phosphate phosphatase H [Protomyces lactucae-debilis]
MHSHHSHSGQYCTHAAGQLEECITEAERQGFSLFCLTEHIPRYELQDLYPGETQTLDDLTDMFTRYHKHARALQARYKQEKRPMQLLVGLETEYIRKPDLARLDALRESFPVDFMVGSVHHVDGIPIDFDKATFLKAMEPFGQDISAFYKRYFEHQLEVMQTFQPAVIGHFDVILLMAPEGTDLLAHEAVCRQMQRNIEYAVGYGALFELNSAAFRKGWDCAYPSRAIIRLMQDAGARFCLSDDSHGPKQIGLNYAKMQAYVKEVGISQLHHLEASTGELIGGRLQVKVVGTDMEAFFAFKARGET